MKITRESLALKGWSEDEIDKTIDILEEAKEKKHPHAKLLDKVVYWFGLILIIFGNFAFSVFIIPLLVVVKGFSLYLIILILAVSFGIIMSIIIRDIEHLQLHHHLALFSIIPIVGLINFFIVVNMVNNIPLTKTLNVYHNPAIVGITYLLGFLIPYAYFIFEDKWKK